MDDVHAVPWCSSPGAEGRFAEYVAFAEASDNLEENLQKSRENLSGARSDLIVCDINLRADESPTITMAKEFGHLTQDGEPMNFHQAVEALWIIHGDLFESRGVTKARVAALLSEVS